VAGQKYTVKDLHNCGISSWDTDSPGVISISGSTTASLQAFVFDPNRTTVVIWGKNSEGTTYPITLTVSRPNMFLTDHATVSVGTTAALLYMELYESTGEKIPASYWPGSPQFTSDNPAIATATIGAASGIGRNVNVTGVSAGGTVIRTSYLGASGASVITSTSAPAASVTLSTTQVWMVAGGNTFRISATVKDAAGNVLTKPVAWSSSNPSAATVDQTGLITSGSGGDTLVRAQVDGVYAEASVSVSIGCFDCP